MDQKKKILEFIRIKMLAVLATTAPTGQPEAALVGIGQTDNFELIFGTDKTARKYSHLKQNPRVALVIGWDDEITIQLEGTAAELVGDELARLKELFFQKVPSARKYDHPTNMFFKVTPSWARYSDLHSAPPEIFEVTW